jgi:hypothetical protein
MGRLLKNPRLCRGMFIQEKLYGFDFNYGLLSELCAVAAAKL